jgi:hypothetical protein
MNDVCDIWSSPWRTLHRSAPPAPAAAAAARQQAVRQAAVWQEAASGTGSWLGRARTVASLKKRIRSVPTAAL